jgi:phosphate transport system substrate-binding protein
MIRIIKTLLIFSLIAALVGCTANAPAASPMATAVPSAKTAVSYAPIPTTSSGAVVFTRDNMPRIDGSTANIPLISAVRSVLLGIAREDNIAVLGTDSAYVSLIDGKTDILLVYAPAQASLDYAQKKNVKLEMLPIGKDALVFLVNKKNTLTNLTEKQIVDIYSGKITNWKDVDGKDAVIIPYQRQLLSGSQTMMDKLVMKGTKMMDAPSTYYIGAMNSLVDAVAVYDGAENAIGYNVYYYVSTMKLDENIRLLSVGGVAPSTKSIASGAYPFVNDFYVVIRADAPKDSPQRILFNWIQSKDGQALVAHEGYVPAK